MKPSGIGGQAVIEGIMMRNKNVYSIAVRKPDKEIEVIKKENVLLTEKYKFLNLPIIRGIVNFVESLVVGTSTLTYSASFFEEPEEQEPTKLDNFAKAIFKDRLDSILMAVTVIVSIAIAIGLFMLVPYYASRLLSKFIVSRGALNLVEGLIRVLLFLIYVVAISFMEDIKRVFMYHGAEHKCINCIEHGMELNVENVRKSSRLHKRCGTSFLFLVMIISVIFFIFIKVDNTFGQVGLRLLLVPIIAGVSYEIIRWAGKNDNKLVDIVSKPGMWIQMLTTKEPDDSMIEVGIAAVEQVFDWKQFLKENEAEISDELETQEQMENAKVPEVPETDEVSETLEEPEDKHQTASEESERLGNLGSVDEPVSNEAKGTSEAEEEKLETPGNLDETSNQEESDSEETDADDDDDDGELGISFLDEQDDATEAEVIPIFKQRKTDF